MTTNYTKPSPSQKVLKNDGTFVDAWWRYLIGLSPADVEPDSAITVTASPFAYTASDSGFVIVSGGTVSSITIKRSGTAYSVGITAGQVQVGRGDVVTVTYTVAPTMAIFPL